MLVQFLKSCHIKNPLLFLLRNMIKETKMENFNKNKKRTWKEQTERKQIKPTKVTEKERRIK